jgi:Fungal fucose-specific lectin
MEGQGVVEGQGRSGARRGIAAGQGMGECSVGVAMVGARGAAVTARRAIGVCLVAFCVSLVFLGVPALGATVGSGLASPPSWAVGKRVHFFRTPAGASALAQQRLHAHTRRPRGYACQTGCGVGTPPLIYHGGPIQQVPQIFLIFWGSNWRGVGSSAMTQVNTLFNAFFDSAYQGILSQYYGPAQTYISPFTRVYESWVDESQAAPSNVDSTAIEGEVAHAITTRGWKGKEDSNSQFVVLTAPGSTYASGFGTGEHAFCAYHSTYGVSSTYSFDPYPGDPPFSSPNHCPRYDPAENAANALSFVASHEYAESASDPRLNAWYTSDRYEIGDLCAYAGEVTFGNAHVTNLWDNYQNACSSEDTTVYPPDVTTTASSVVLPLQAILNGTVTPRGQSTTYHFDYGTTTGYGSSTPNGAAGSGYTSVGENATVTGLEPSTTYHYRIVASSSAGTTLGGDQVFTTCGLVEAVTGGPSSVLENQATLSGTVNPRGCDAKYYFQYGKTTSYGSVTAEGDAGAGSSPVPETAVPTKLAANTVYHYRLVGTSGGITSYGADQKFTTQEEPSSSRWMAYDRNTGRIMLYYQGSNGQIDAWNYENGVGWAWGEHGGHAAAAGTSPTMSYNPETGRIMVYYQGSNGQIDAWNYENGVGWAWGEHGGHAAAAGTSPTMAYDRSTGRIMVYYQGSNGQIDAWNYENGVGWIWGEHAGHAAATGTSPAVAYDRSTGRIMVYYQGSNGQIDAWNYENGVGWAWGEHGGHAAAAGTSPTMSYNPETGRIMVYYQGSNKSIDVWNYEIGEGWVWGEHGGHP